MIKNKEGLKNPKILIFLTDSLLGMLLENAFSSRNFEVKIFYDCENIVNLVTDENPDLLLYDILIDKTREVRGGKNGFRTLRLLKENEKTKDFPLIIFSDICYRETVKKGLRLGAEEYLCLDSYPPPKAADFCVDYLVKKHNFSERDFQKK